MTSQPTTRFELSPGTQIVEFDSSTRSKTYRVELTNGVHFQVNDKVYHLLSSLHSPMTLTTLAAEFQQRTGQSVGLDQLQQLSERFVTQGIMVEHGLDGQRAVSKPSEAVTQPDAFLGLHYRRELFSAETLAPFARALQVFFHRPLAIALMTVVAVVHVLAYRQIGFPPHLDMTVVNWPLFYSILLVSIGIHELGHLAACQRWQCPHGPLGFGLYFLNPVFYVDVTPAWRLSRQQRAVVDIGGMYLQLLCVPLFWIAFLLTQEPTYLFVIFVTDMMILSNFEPLMKLDGYWLLSDLTGVPNLHTRTGEAMQRALLWLFWRCGWRSERPQASSFNEWSTTVRWVMVVYVALSALIWPLMLLGMIPMLVNVIATYPALWQTAFNAWGTAIHTHNFSGLLTQSGVLFLPTLMLLNVAVLIKITWSRWRKARAEKALLAVKPTLAQQPA